MLLCFFVSLLYLEIRLIVELGLMDDPRSDDFCGLEGLWLLHECSRGHGFDLFRHCHWKLHCEHLSLWLGGILVIYSLGAAGIFVG